MFRDAPRLRRLLRLGLFFAGVCAMATPAAGEPQTEPEGSPIATIEQALTSRLEAGPAAAPLTKRAMTSADARRIVRTNLDPALLRGALAAVGWDFRFRPADKQSDEQMAVLVLSYPDQAAAEGMKRKLAKLDGYFRRAKILTRFSSIARANQLAIVFTENAGDDALVKFVDGLASLFPSTR